MGCEVCIGGCDETFDNYERENRISDSPSACYECAEIIPAGSEYEFASGDYGREPTTRMTTCLLCAEIADVFSCGEGRMHGNLWESMEEHAFEDLTTATECFRELSAAAKQRVLDRWNKWKFNDAK